MTTDTGNFSLHRSFSISADQLWHLLTDPEMRGSWNSPSDDMKMTLITSDFKVGGAEHHRCGPADEPHFEAHTRWYHINAPHDAAFTETIEAGGEAIATSLVTYRITPKDDQIELFISVAVSSFCGEEALSEFQHGWEVALSKLEKLAI